jgi:hypothetical protein
MNSVQQSIIQQLRRELEVSEATEHLIDWLLESWETLEILRDRFGEARAVQLLIASPSLLPTSVLDTTLV